MEFKIIEDSYMFLFLFSSYLILNVFKFFP